MNEKPTILIIDEDVQTVDSMKPLLESVGYQVYYAYQPETGFELAKETLPELILLDVMFSGPPGPHGFQIARELHTDPNLSEVPVIILSGVRKTLGISYRLLPNEKWLPIKAFLETPVKPDELLDEINNAIPEKV